MMGAAIATKRRAHLGLTILTDAVSPKARKILLTLGFAIGTVFCAALFWYGIEMVRHQIILGQVTPTMQWPEWIFGAVFLTIRFAQATIEEAKAPIETEKKEEPWT